MTDAKHKMHKYPLDQGGASSLICVNSVCHVIGGRGSNGNVHTVWNDHTKQWQHIYTFDEYKDHGF